ncbi:unnamed protein product, partial [marine sediment metagenome]
MAESNTKICNQALGRIGSTRINDFSDASEKSTQAIQCRLHYEQTRDALIRSYPWRFALARATLVQDTETPDFEWSFQYLLPNDFMLMKSIYEGRFSSNNFRNYALEGKLLLTDETTMEIRYVKKVTDPTQFDPLFVELFTLTLADKFIGPLAGGDARIQKKIDDALDKLMPAVRALDGQETNTAGRFESGTWNDSRYGGRTGFPMRF